MNNRHVTRNVTRNVTRTGSDLSMPLRVAELSADIALEFRLEPGPEARAKLAQDLGVSKLKKLTFTGRLVADGRHDYRLDGQLGASVVQACVVSAEPVTTRIDIAVVRRFLRRMPEPDGPESRMPDDETIEPLGVQIDPGMVMAEALALALPDYPRAPGVAFVDGAEFPPDGREAPRRNPFAALAALKPDQDE